MFAYALEITMDSEDKTEEATANLRVCGKFSVTGRARKQTFARDIFFLYHIKTSVPVFQLIDLSQKIWENILTYTSK